LIECDIHVPKSIHDTFSPNPLFPEKRDGKLMAILYDKQHYIDHVLALQFGVRHRYIINKKNEVQSKMNFKNSSLIHSSVRHARILNHIINSNIGATVLSISKVVMRNYYYDWLKPMYGDNMKLMYTDTDSLVLEIIHPNSKQYMMLPENNEIFEIGDHNKRIPGKFKLEKEGIV
jgi:hypothetical protein